MYINKHFKSRKYNKYLYLPFYDTGNKRTLITEVYIKPNCYISNSPFWNVDVNSYSYTEAFNAWNTLKEINVCVYGENGIFGHDYTSSYKFNHLLNHRNYGRRFILDNIEEYLLQIEEERINYENEEWYCVAEDENELCFEIFIYNNNSSSKANYNKKLKHKNIIINFGRDPPNKILF